MFWVSYGDPSTEPLMSTLESEGDECWTRTNTLHSCASWCPPERKTWLPIFTERSHASKLLRRQFPPSNLPRQKRLLQVRGLIPLRNPAFDRLHPLIGQAVFSFW